MKKIDLMDCTFGINIRFTTEDRKRNIRLVIEHLLQYTDTNIVVAEEDNKSIFPTIISEIRGWTDERCKYIFIESDSEFMGKTRAFNRIFKEIKTPIYVLQDADVICSPEMYLEAANRIRNKQADFCYSFDGHCFNVPENIIPLFENDLDYNVLNHNNTNKFSDRSPGGSIFIDSEVYVIGGMDNENMKAWGYDDDERVTRFRKLGFTISRVDGTLYHINHGRTSNSTQSSQTNVNMRELQRVNSMKRNELLKEIKTWPWVNK
jgi:hypothetical protein